MPHRFLVAVLWLACVAMLARGAAAARPTAPQPPPVALKIGDTHSATWSSTDTPSVTSFGCRVPVDGDLTVLWLADVPARVSVLDASRRQLQSRDADSNGVVVRLPVVAETSLTIEIDWPEDDESATGDYQISLSLDRETDATLSAVTEARQAAAESTRLRDAGDASAARQRVAAAIESMMATAGARQSPGIMQQLNDHGLLAWQLGDVRACLAAWQAAYEYQVRRQIATHPSVMQAAQRVAFPLKAVGEIDKALELEERLLAESLARFDEDSMEVQRARTNLALTLRDAGDLNRARMLQERTVASFERSAGEDHPELPRALDNLAGTIAMQGDPQAAHALFSRVLAVRERTLPDDHIELNRTRENLAGTMKMMGDYHGAARIYEKVLAIRLNQYPADHPDVQASRQNLALTLRYEGELEQARELEESVLETRIRTLAPGHPDIHVAQLNLGTTLRVIGDLQRSHELLREAITGLARLVDDEHPALQAARSALASTLSAQGNPLDARLLMERVVAVWSRTLSQEDSRLQAARSNLAAHLRRMGELSAARRLFEDVLRAMAGSRTVGEDNHVPLAQLGLARTLKELGELDEARRYADRALSALETNLPETHPKLLAVRTLTAGMYVQPGDFAKKRALLEKNLQVLRDAFPVHAREKIFVCQDLIVTLVDLQDREAAIAAGHELARGLDANWRAVVGRLSPREVEDSVLSTERAMSVLLWLAGPAFEEEAPPELVADAFRLVESRRSAGLVGAAIRSRTQHAGDEVEDVHRLEERRQSARLASLLRTGGNRDDLLDTKLALEDVRRRLQERYLKSTVAAPFLEAPDVASLQAGMTADQALVSFFEYRDSHSAVTGRSLAAFVLRRDGLQRVELGPSTSVAGLVEDWRAAALEEAAISAARGIVLAGPGPASDVSAKRNRLGRELSNTLIGPLLASLDGARRVDVTLEGCLHSLPLDALPLGDRWFGDRFSLRVRSTLAELLWPAPTPGKGTLVAMGGVDFGSAPSAAVPSPEKDADVPSVEGQAAAPAFVALPGTAREVREIAELWSTDQEQERQPILLSGTQATTDRILQEAPRARWLHLATHGWFAPEAVSTASAADPIDGYLEIGQSLPRREQILGSSPLLLSGLAFAGANAPSNELGRMPGVLTAEQLASLDLRACELAVLSACETNVGIVRAGQGVESLQKALTMAGAHGVLTSLWSVPDEATRELMTEFYRGLWKKNLPPHEALWQAKRSLAARKRPVADWAGWILKTSRPD